jgi:hypothetical protein
MSVPTFRADATALAEELAAVLCAPFPAVEDARISWVSQTRCDGLTLIARLQQVASMVAGAEKLAMAEQIAHAVAERDERTPAEHAEMSAVAETALLLQVSSRTAGERIAEAKLLHERLPRTLAALRDGLISASKALVMVDETTLLDAPEAARVEEKVFKGGAPRTRSAFKLKVRREVERVDPDARIKKRERARKDREVVTFEAEDGLDAINALIPAEQAALAWRAIDEHAKSLRVTGDERTIGALRADALVDLLVNRSDGTARVGYDVAVLVPVGTVLGTTEDDAHIPGHGPVPADVVRTIAAQATSWRRVLTDPATGAVIDANRTRYQPRIRTLRATANAFSAERMQRFAADSSWQRLLTDPDTSDRLDVHPDTYKPGGPLQRFIKLRDQHCRFPGCGRPARFCDVDHTIPHRRGGLTIRKNLACFCRRHHRTKQLPGWKVVQGEHGELIFTTPTGGIYRTRPPNPDGTEE